MVYSKVVLSLLMVFLLVLFIKQPAFAEVKEIDIVTTPDKILFNVTNMKPGDWAIRELNIKNSGFRDFDYLFSSRLKSGSTPLYNELLLTVTSGDQELYKGRLGGFSKLDSRSLKSGTEEKLTLRVDFPELLGNEFQGLATEVEFKFYVEGSLGGVLPVTGSGPLLPDTATNMFTFIIGGIALLGVGSMMMFVHRRLQKNL